MYCLNLTTVGWGWWWEVLLDLLGRVPAQVMIVFVFVFVPVFIFVFVFVRYCLTHLDVCQHKWWQPVCIFYTALQIVVSFSPKRKFCFYLFSTRCFSIYPLARAHSHCQMMARVGTIWPDRHYIGCFLAISDQIVAAFDWSCQLRCWPVGSQSSVTALRPTCFQPRLYNDDDEEEKLLDVVTSSVSARGSSKSSGGFVDASLSRDSQDRVPRLCFSVSTSVYNTSHCIVDSTIQKNPPWRCDHLRGQREPQATQPWFLFRTSWGHAFYDCVVAKLPDICNCDGLVRYYRQL